MLIKTLKTLKIIIEILIGENKTIRILHIKGYDVLLNIIFIIFIYYLLTVNAYSKSYLINLLLK